MMRALCEKLEFPKEATEVFIQTYDKIRESKEAFELFCQAADKVFLDENNYVYKPFIEKAAEITGINFFTVNMVFWLFCARPMKYYYKAKNITEEKYFESLLDLKYKLDECKKRFDVWGAQSCWFRNFFVGGRLPHGRLQFDIDKWKDGDYKDFLKNGDLIFRCHIPSSGPLYPEEVMKSFKLLYEANKDKLKDGIIAIRCSSWLLYPPIIECCKETSNIRKFYELFDIIEVIERGDPYDGIIVIFDKDYDGPDYFNNVPTNTSFQRAMKKYFEDGGKMGGAVGVILFDGEKIINH